MTIETIKDFISTEDFGFACTTGVFGAICNNEAREILLENVSWDDCNTPELLEGEALEDVLAHFPEFQEEIDNGCEIYAIEEYEHDGANRIETYYIAYYK